MLSPSSPNDNLSHTDVQCMKTPLSPEQRQQLATVLTYCREIGGVDFYRGLQDRSISDLEPLAASSQPTPTPEPVIVESLPIMSPKSSLLSVPAPIDFSSPAIAPQARAAALEVIRQDIGDCTRCQLAFEGRHKIVFGDGDPNAELLFVGEGPGADEDDAGHPFCWTRRSTAQQHDCEPWG